MIFSQEQDAPPNDEIIFWTLEGVKNELKSAEKKLLQDYIHKADLFCFLESLEIENISAMWQTYQQSKAKH